MDYKEIVLKCCNNISDREHLDSYFYREWKKAEKEYYEPVEFFDGCMGVVKSLEWAITFQATQEREQLLKWHREAKDRVYPKNEGETNEEFDTKLREIIEHCERELPFISIDNYKAKGFNMNQVLIIRDAILKVIARVMPDEPNKNAKPPKPIKTFSQYFEHKKAEKLVEELKKEFISDCTKTTFALLIYTLRNEFEYPLIKIGSKEFSDFHEAMRIYFDGINIGTRQYFLHIAKTLKGNLTYKNDIQTCKNRINKILHSIDLLQSIDK